ncbi:MAG: hypothetical protein QXT25_00445 [Candidatus Anstonellaceae archaeon]
MSSKFPHPSDIPWDKIQKIKVARDTDKEIYSFEFDLHGRMQKITITIGPDSTSYTLSSADGTPLLHGVQKGKEFKLYNFSSKIRK